MKPSPLLSLILLASSCRAAGPSQDAGPSTPGPELAVGFLIVDGVYNTELTAPYDVFHHTVFHADPGMRVFTVAPTLAPVRTFEGLRVWPDHSCADAPRIDVLVVPSAEHHLDTDLENGALIDWVRRVGGNAKYVVSLCDGAFVLAQAGLLDGLSATTFPADIAAFRERFGSRVDCLDGVSFVHDGRVITSVGGARSFDAALYLCEVLYGAEAARGIGRGLVIDWNLSGIEHALR